jgi:hypothetical protein
MHLHLLFPKGVTVDLISCAIHQLLNGSALVVRCWLFHASRPRSWYSPSMVMSEGGIHLLYDFSLASKATPCVNESNYA